MLPLFACVPFTLDCRPALRQRHGDLRGIRLRTQIFQASHPLHHRIVARHAEVELYQTLPNFKTQLALVIF
jgi:hypothetical protein